MSVQHKKPLLIYFICAFLIFCLLAVFISMALLEYFSSRTTLKFVLHIPTVPKSVQHLRSGCDVMGAGEIDCFYFTIAPEDFKQLLTGRNYEITTNKTLQAAHTMEISPPASVSGHAYYDWQTPSAGCSIATDDSHEHVIVIYGSN
jgi:hypothetical protein